MNSTTGVYHAFIFLSPAGVGGGGGGSTARKGDVTEEVYFFPVVLLGSTHRLSPVSYTEREKTKSEVGGCSSQKSKKAWAVSYIFSPGPQQTLVKTELQEYGVYNSKRVNFERGRPF